MERWHFYAAMLRYPFRNQRRPRALATSILFVVSQAATALGYLRERLKSGPRPRLGRQPVP
jgi:hypothetical protein